jgi:hypothetical protein
MWSPVRQAATLAASLFLVVPSLAAEDPPPREAIAKRAKAATALVEVKPTTGSGFCVHPSGLFVTNDHLARQGADGVTVVLNAGRKDQRVLKAKVLRRDKALDLALLKVDGDEKFEVLELGTDKDLGELAELITCGFPFGHALARPGEYPAISINVSRVSSLRHDAGGDLHRIQLDGAINPGNSGGPVLDRGGKVVGVVVSGIVGTGVSMAIPVSHLQRFLARPGVDLTLPAVKADNRHGTFEFTAKTISLLPAEESLELELILGTGPGKERRFPMKRVDGVYRARVVPFPEREGPPVCRVEVKYEDGSVTGSVEDRAIRVGEREVKLSQVRQLRPGSKPEARLGDGQRLGGKWADLEVPVKVGKHTLRLDLAGALEVNVEPPEEVTALSCTVLSRQAGREIGRHSEPLYIAGVSRPTIEALAEDKFVKPVRSGAPVSYLRVVSSKGDYIGQGKSYSYDGDELNVQTNNRGVTVSVGGWTLNFGGPGNLFLGVGEYDGAKRFPFSGDAPGIEFYGNGRGCNMIAGKFVVWELEVKGNQVRLAIDFVQRCEEKMPPLYGSLRINSSFH